MAKNIPNGINSQFKFEAKNVCKFALTTKAESTMKSAQKRAFPEIES